MTDGWGTAPAKRPVWQWLLMGVAAIGLGFALLYLVVVYVL